MIVENILCHIEKLEKSRIRNGVIDITAGLASDHNITYSHNCELLRDICRFYAQQLAQFIHALLAIAKAVEDSNPDRVSEGLEKLRLEVGKLLRHAIPLYGHTLICEYYEVKERDDLACEEGAAIDMPDQAEVHLFRVSSKTRSSENGNGRKSLLISTADAAPEFGTRFRLVESLKELHQTPFGTTQQFLYCYCRIE
jgi:hypothetical protein